MSNKILAGKCLAKKAPFYQYEKGWAIDTRKNDPEVGYIHITSRWYKTYSEAKADYPNQYQLAKERVLSVKKKSPLLDENLPFKKFMEKFSDYRLTKVRGSTFYHLDKFVQSNFFEEHYDKPIKDIFNRDFAAKFKESVMAKKLTKAYKNKALGYYRQMCEYVFGSGMLPSDQYPLCKFATEPIGREEETVKPTKDTFALTDEEVDKLLAVIDHPVYKMLTEFLFATGFRLSEALALTPREIDFDKRTITREYVIQVDEYGSERRFHRTKNGFEGTFPASGELLASLLTYINDRFIGDDEYLFPCSTDLHRPLERNWYRKKPKAYCKQAGIREIPPHIARHTFCTKVASMTGDSNADRKSLEMLTGHTASVNQSTYTHADENTMREIVDNINRRA